jgi:hypothetical protein
VTRAAVVDPLLAEPDLLDVSVAIEHGEGIAVFQNPRLVINS